MEKLLKRIMNFFNVDTYKELVELIGNDIPEKYSSIKVILVACVLIILVTDTSSELGKESPDGWLWIHTIYVALKR